MSARTPRRRITSALEAFDAAGDRLDRLDAARRLREAADELEAAEFRVARKAGVTWSEIGACYGLTKQGAQQRFLRGEQRNSDAATSKGRTKPDPQGKPR